ncbi:MAG: lysine--tRNA ligase [Candidatus Bathyarchaeia archaeon]
MSEIIGHGTWYDKAAWELIEREKELGRDLSLIRSESGLGASGFPHIGSLGDAIRSCAIALAVEAQGYNSESIAFSDDMDGLRKVPAGLPRSLEKWLGVPVTSIPDPFKCHDSYGEHMSLLLLEALDECGAEYTYMSGREVYEKGLLDDQIRKLLVNSERVGRIIEEEIGQEKFKESLPYFPLCSQCGRIYTTRAYKYLPEEGKILYKCEGMEVKGRMLEGCGHEGEADVFAGEGKLSWKVEFAARWAALDIRFEAYGKDIADSVRVNDRICREVLEYEPPMHAQYEMFLDKSGKKISKSAGNVFTPQVWFRYGSPQSLMLLILKRFVGTRAISVMDIPRYMDEFDQLEDIYLSKKPGEDELERVKLTGLYKYCWILKPPEEPGLHVPYNLMAYLAKVAPRGKEESFIKEMLKRYGYLGESVLRDLEDRIRYALNWVEDFEEIGEKEISLEVSEASAIKALIGFLGKEVSGEEIQGAIFNIAKENALKPGRLFRRLYQILLGVDRGPRLGPYIKAMGEENVIEALERALKGSPS